KDGDRRGQSVQRVGMTSERALMLRPGRLYLAPVKRKAGGDVLAREIDDGEDAPVAGHDGSQGAVEHCRGAVLLLDVVTRLRTKQFLALADGCVGARRLHGR